MSSQDAFFHIQSPWLWSRMGMCPVLYCYHQDLCL